MPVIKSERKPKKEKVFHPDSRKAGQLARAQLRKARLGEQAIKKTRRNEALADKYVFFFHAIPPEADSISLPELHKIIREAWLTRHDLELEEERSMRRKGRPISVKESKIEELKLREREEYRTGMEVPDLTHRANVALYRRWDQSDIAFINMLRFVRISSEDPSVLVVSRPGRHASLLTDSSHTMDVDAAG